LKKKKIEKFGEMEVTRPPKGDRERIGRGDVSRNEIGSERERLTKLSKIGLNPQTLVGETKKGDGLTKAGHASVNQHK